MRTLITGSSGHLGGALMRVLRRRGEEVVGLDRSPGPVTDRVVDIVDRAAVRDAVDGCDAVLHAATLHKPHVATHSKQAFVDGNVTGTLNLLECSADAGVGAFVFTSSTSAYGRSLSPGDGAPAAWIDEQTPSIAKNIYGATKTAAEDLCALVFSERGLPVVVLRTSRFFPEADDNAEQRAAWDDTNLKANELLHRRVDLADAVEAHVLARDKAADIGFDRFIISATTPFSRDEAAELRASAPAVIGRHVAAAEAVFAARGFRLPSSIDRVYDNRRARERLGWAPVLDFAKAVERLGAGAPLFGPLAAEVGNTRYHEDVHDGEGPYPVG